MTLDAAAVKELILSEGIDLVGIADARDLILASPTRPATALMPTARSVIVMAVSHSLGAVYAPDLKLWTRNKMQTSRLLDRVAEKTGRLLERKGFLSLPVSADKPVEIHKTDMSTGRPLVHTRVLGQLSLKHAAVSAGLGAIGRSNLLITERFGPHVRLGAVITELPLEPDRAREYDPCPPGCRMCVAACPVSALEGGAYTVDPCFHYWSWGFERVPPKRLKDWPAYVRMLLRNHRRRDFVVEFGQTLITDVDNCIACMKACPAGTEWEAIRPRQSKGREE
jgi:epoxyqueuosine reductase QueG